MKILTELKDGIGLLFFLAFIVIASPFLLLMILSDKMEEA